MPKFLQSRCLHLAVAVNAAGYGADWWLSEWLWQPGNDASDLLAFQAFAANYVVLLVLYVRALSGKAADNA